MIEKTEEQIAAEKAAVESMKGAKKNMEAALGRIDTLERGLRYAIDHMRSHKGYVGAALRVDRDTTVHAAIDRHIELASGALG